MTPKASSCLCLVNRSCRHQSARVSLSFPVRLPGIPTVWLCITSAAKIAPCVPASSSRQTLTQRGFILRAERWEQSSPCGASVQTFFLKTPLMLELIPRLLKAKAATFLCEHEASGEMSGINSQEMRTEESEGGVSDIRKARITVPLHVGGCSEGQELLAGPGSHQGESEK